MKKDDDLDRRLNDPWRDQMDERMAAIEVRIEHIAKNTEEIVEFFQSGKGFFRVVRGVGTASRFVGYIAGAAVILWAVGKFGISQLLADMGIKK